MLELSHGNPKFTATHKMLVEMANSGWYLVTFMIDGVPRVAFNVPENELLGYAQLYKEEFFVTGGTTGFWFQLDVLDALELQEYVSERMLL